MLGYAAMNDPGFAQLQSRLQARHGERLTPAQWYRLEGVVTMDPFVARARETSLAVWLEGVDPRGDVHHLEERMRLAWIRHVERVAGWTPEAWRGAVRWWGVLPDLEVARWQARMNDRVGGGFLRNPERDAAEGRSPVFWGEAYPWFARLDGIERLEIPADVIDLFDWWLARWRRFMPEGATQAREWREWRRLAHAVRASLIAWDASGKEGLGWESRLLLERQFRRQALRPGALFIHLGLAALDLIRLRGALCRRALFAQAEAA
ncbi:MAG: hypothetical protein HQL86_05595 [Magnetococcales bacterium]|nr:hypothetical protein [Magnetococcales bacterium]